MWSAPASWLSLRVEPAAGACSSESRSSSLHSRIVCTLVGYCNSVVVSVWQERQASCGATSEEEATSEQRPTPPPHTHIVARSLQENSIALLMSAAPPHRRAVAASRCRKPTACSRYPAIQGCSTRSTPSCRFRRTLSRAVRLGPSSSSRAGHGILNYFT